MKKFDIEKRNKQFQKMTPEQRRVAVAQDVIAYVKQHAIQARMGYFYIAMPDDTERGKQVHELIAEKSCTVCAIGAVFMGFVGWTDNCRVQDIGTLASDYNLIDRLDGVFSRAQLRAMEVAFEGKDVDGKAGQSLGRADITAARKFNSRLRKADARLIRIMENVIANNGTFNPAAQTSAKDSATPTDAPATA